MRFLHVSDLHIGKRVNGMSMVEDQRHILAQIVGLARKHTVDALVIAGDIYDKAAPSAEAVGMLDAFLTELAAAGIRVLGIPGNHDSAERIAYAQGLLANQGVCLPPVYDGNIQAVELHDEFGPVVFGLVPFLKPGDVRRHFPDREIGDDYTAAVVAALDACDIDADVRNVAVSHQLVTAGSWSPDRADDEIKLGGIDNVDVSVYDAFDYVALGHVHRPQRVGRDTVRYSGSPLKYSFSEARYPKSAVLVELGKKDAGQECGSCVSFELVPLVPLHDMREVRGTLQELLAQGGEDAPGSQDYVHVTLSDEHPQLDAMARVREVFPNAMALDYDNVAVFAQRAQARDAVDPDKVDMAELFARFYEEQTGRALDDEQTRIVADAVQAVQAGRAQDDGGEGGAR